MDGALYHQHAALMRCDLNHGRIQLLRAELCIGVFLYMQDGLINSEMFQWSVGQGKVIVCEEPSRGAVHARARCSRCPPF